MTFNSEAKQDQFVANILKFKKNGFFVDIGSCDAIGSNNTFFFESLNWNGLCVESNSIYNNSYKNRQCTYINEDAFKLNYLEIFKKLNFPKSIDYLSVDIDELSFNLLTKLPHENYRFKVITIEHDSYHLGGYFKEKQRDFLNTLNYELIIANVFVEQYGYGPNLPFEDWWVDPKEFDTNYINKIKSENIYPSQIISKFSN
jgi:hypothetical protein